MRLALDHQTAKFDDGVAGDLDLLRLALDHQTAKLKASKPHDKEALRLALDHQTAKFRIDAEEALQVVAVGPRSPDR